MREVVPRQHRVAPPAGIHGGRRRGEHRVSTLLERRAERDPDLGAVLRAAEGAPECRDARPDSGQGKVEEGPGLPGEAVRLGADGGGLTGWLRTHASVVSV